MFTNIIMCDCFLFDLEIKKILEKQFIIAKDYNFFLTQLCEKKKCK